MVKKVYSAVLNINFDDFDDFEEYEDGVESDSITEKVSDISRMKILKCVYLNLLMTLGPKVKSIFSNYELVNDDKLHTYYNMVLNRMDYENLNNNNENLIYDFFTVARGEFTEINIGFSAKSVYIATVSSRKCVEQEVVANYIEKNFLTVFLNETAKDTIRYENIFGVNVEDVKNLFMYATILSLKNDAYPISFSPLDRFTKNAENEQLVKDKLRRIFRTLLENFGE